MTAVAAMNVAGIGLCLAALIRIGLLPRTFFRPGRRNLAWWLNAAPFWVAGSGLLAALLGVARPYLERGGWASGASSAFAMVASAAALWLIARTRAAHTRPPALWHQPDDAPEHLVTAGPYACVRHPFYAAFLLALIGCVLAAPHWSTLLALAFAAHRLNGTAAAEEARFLGSTLGARYAAYMRGSGRFVPLRRGVAAARGSVEAEMPAMPIAGRPARAPDALPAVRSAAGPTPTPPAPRVDAASAEADPRPGHETSQPLRQE